MSGTIFTPAERERLREILIAAARADSRITGAAVTGSSSAGHEDRWSDIDLAPGLAETADMPEVMADWTETMYRHGAVHHLDVWRGVTCFRVFLLADTLQVDLAFRPAPDFRATGPAFRLLFGEAEGGPPLPPPNSAELVGLGWVYALHVRSSLRRGRVRQAEWMLSRTREQVVALACSRHGLPAYEGRGFDDLPFDVTRPLDESFPRSLGVPELERAFRVTGDGLRRELELADPALAARLAGPLGVLLG